MNKWNLEDWLNEAEVPMLGGQPDSGAGQAPTTQPDAGGGMNLSPPQAGTNDPNIANQDKQGQQKKEDIPDISKDPQHPEMPEDKKKEDFETWKKRYFKESIKGDSNTLIDMLNSMRQHHLSSYQSKFVEDNLNVQILRQYANIEKASREIRKMINDDLDQNNPATSLAAFITDVLKTLPTLNHIFIKLNGYGAMKQDLHRKYIASLIGGVQVGSGGNLDDVVYNSAEYSIAISTRFNARWGDVILGQWTLRESDSEELLSEPEQKRLEEGSPEEREVLRRRVVVESISKLFNQRSFLINVVNDDGTIYTVGIDLSNALKGAYTEGKLVVRSHRADNLSAQIDDSGKIVPLIELKINFVKETGEQDEEGLPEKEEVPFMETRNGVLYLIADMQTIRESASIIPATVFKENPYDGNHSDLQVLTRCVYSSHDLLLKFC